MNIILTLLILSILVVVHEFGHYLTARIFHVKVVEFAVGMGPVILSKSKNNIKYSLRALPFGGFNRFAAISAWNLEKMTESTSLLTSVMLGAADSARGISS